MDDHFIQPNGSRVRFWQDAAGRILKQQINVWGERSHPIRASDAEYRRMCENYGVAPFGA